MSHHVFILEIKKLLQGVEGWLDKAVMFAAAKKFDPNTLLQARLAPDMFPFVRQIQSACDSAKYAASRTAGKEPPSHPDTETTIDDLKKRVQTVVAYLDTFKESDFAGADERLVSLPRWEGKSMTATNYLVQHAMPNFFFHLTTTYAILRHNGVELGKRDYLGAIQFQ
jgi:uncharacterized protein